MPKHQVAAAVAAVILGIGNARSKRMLMEAVFLIFPAEVKEDARILNAQVALDAEQITRTLFVAVNDH